MIATELTIRSLHFVIERKPNIRFTRFQASVIHAIPPFLGRLFAFPFEIVVHYLLSTLYFSSPLTFQEIAIKISPYKPTLFESVLLRFSPTFTLPRFNYSRNFFFVTLMNGAKRVAVSPALTGLVFSLIETFLIELLAFYFAGSAAGLRYFSPAEVFSVLPSHAFFRLCFSPLKLIFSPARNCAVTFGVEGVPKVLVPRPSSLLTHPTLWTNFLSKVFDREVFIRSLISLALTAPFDYLLSQLTHNFL